MNKRQIKKKLNQSNIKINSIKLDNDETLILSLPNNKYTNKQQKYFYYCFRECFPNNKIMIVPNDMKLTKIKTELNK